MRDRTHQLDRIYDVLRERGYRPGATFDQAVTSRNGKGGRVEHWSAKHPAGTGPKGDRLVQIGLKHGAVVEAEIYAPLVEGNSLTETLEAL